MTSSTLRAVVLAIAASLLGGCATERSDGAPCPPAAAYSSEFLARAADELDLLPAGSAIEQMLADYQVTPDVALIRVPDAETKPLIILDAKYRIDDGLNAALSSIHTYRDALVREAATGTIEGVVRAAYLLTPHIPALDAEYRGTAMPGCLFHPDYRPNTSFWPFGQSKNTAEVALTTPNLSHKALGRNLYL